MSQEGQELLHRIIAATPKSCYMGWMRDIVYVLQATKMICETYRFTSVPGRSFNYICPEIYTDVGALERLGIVGDVGYAHPLVLRKPPLKPLPQAEREFLTEIEEHFGASGIAFLGQLIWETNIMGEYDFTGPLEEYELKNICGQLTRPDTQIKFYHQTLQKALS